MLIAVLAFAGCKKCTRYTRAWVVDRETNKAVTGAKVNSYAALNDRSRDVRIVYTDSAGRFETAFALDNVAKCGNLKLIISHPRYHTGHEIDVAVDDTLFLERIKP